MFNDFPQLVVGGVGPARMFPRLSGSPGNLAIFRFVRILGWEGG